jgi:hypothetical protein
MTDGALAVDGALSTVVVPVTVDETVLVVFASAFLLNPKPKIKDIMAIEHSHINQSFFI